MLEIGDCIEKSDFEFGRGQMGRKLQENSTSRKSRRLKEEFGQNCR
jgi:hypothetical protein